VHELVSVAPDGAELFLDGRVVRVDGLAPDRDYELGGVAFRTMEDLGELHCVFATGNDVHFGETVCGQLGDGAGHEVFSVAEGEPPYPEVMSAAVVADVARLAPAAVVVKGDLTNDGVDQDYDRFLRVWGDPFGSRLVHVRGNHDCYRGQNFAAWPCQARVLDGVTLAVLDTARPFEVGGFVDDDQLEWLDELGRTSDQPIVVLGHHPVWNPGQHTEAYMTLAPDDSARLVEVLGRRRSLTSYLAGHTHRNQCQWIGGIPFVEVACVKDFPGGWAEYRVYDRGIAQVFHRAGAPDAVNWAERTRAMYAGYYGPFAMGALSDRSFVVPPR
jgi:3',5'-cyclic-AMP phosphodiesterase